MKGGPYKYFNDPTIKQTFNMFVIAKLPRPLKMSKLTII